MPCFLLSLRPVSARSTVSALSRPSSRVIQPLSTPIGSDESWKPTAAMLQTVSRVLSLARQAPSPTSFQKYWKQPRWISSSSFSSAAEKLYFQAARLSGGATTSAGGGATGSRPRASSGSQVIASNKNKPRIMLEVPRFTRRTTHTENNQATENTENNWRRV